MRNDKKHVLRSKEKGKLLSVTSPFEVREAYNMIRANLLFTGNGRKCPIYAVSSTVPNEGKSMNAMNIAISFSMTGKRVLLIDADMRKPVVDKYFQLRRENGLSELLAQLTGTCVYKQTKYESLFIMTAGVVPPNPAELMNSHAFDELLKVAATEFDYIFIDTPPIGIISDGLALAEKITGYILVVKGMSTERQRLAETVDMIKRLNGNVVGFVMNDIASGSKKKRRGKYGYYDYYSKE